jgi:7-keto-8-aminopelargonate synthetase-like enzyme
VELEGVSRRHLIQIITLSKAFGTHGGAVLADAAITDAIQHRSDAHAGSTPPAIPIAAAATEAVELCRRDPSRRQRLTEITLQCKSQLLAAGLIEELTPGPIFAIEPKSQAANRIRTALLKRRIYPPWIQYPGGPKEGYFRFAFCSEHQDSILKTLLQTLRSAGANKSPRE